MKNPIMSLNELKPGLTFTCTESETGAGKKFTTTVTIDVVKFEGVGSSKKLSKQACARASLSKLFGVNFTARMTKEGFIKWNLLAVQSHDFRCAIIDERGRRLKTLNLHLEYI